MVGTMGSSIFKQKNVSSVIVQIVPTRDLDQVQTNLVSTYESTNNVIGHSQAKEVGSEHAEKVEEMNDPGPVLRAPVTKRRSLPPIFAERQHVSTNRDMKEKEENEIEEKELSPLLQQRPQPELREKENINVHNRTLKENDNLKKAQVSALEQFPPQAKERKQKKNDIEKRIDQLVKENDDLRSANKAWEIQYDDLVREMKVSYGKIKMLEKETDGLRTRLSKMASDRLTDNNPNIADLSDENRAIKVGEQFCELYCNEWSDACEELTANGKRTDSDAVEILLNLLTRIYGECRRIAELGLHDLKHAIKTFTGNTELTQPLSVSLKLYKDARKKNCKATVPRLDAIIEEWNGNANDSTSLIKAYIESATKICWLMCIQHPPLSLYLHCSENNFFNRKYFSPYTVKGKLVDYLVWPALLLHDEGPLLQKGVAQGKKSMKTGIQTELDGNAQGQKSTKTGIQTERMKYMTNGNQTELEGNTAFQDCALIHVHDFTDEDEAREIADKLGHSTAIYTYKDECNFARNIDPSVYTASNIDPSVYTASNIDPSVCTASNIDPSVYTASNTDPSVCTASNVDQSVYSTSIIDPSV